MRGVVGLSAVIVVAIVIALLDQAAGPTTLDGRPVAGPISIVPERVPDSVPDAIYDSDVTPGVGLTTIEPLNWCAMPRPDEPLLRYAIELGTAPDDSRRGLERKIHKIRRVPRSSIVIVKDEATCKRAAESYNNSLSPTPVLVVRLDTAYLVGTLDFDEEKVDAFWRVDLYDHDWHNIAAYSHGS